LADDKRDAIAKVCDEIWKESWMTSFRGGLANGSGTQSNMNVNEVVAYRAHVLHGGALTDKENSCILMMM
jgi:fumarate hydratase class II